MTVSTGHNAALGEQEGHSEGHLVHPLSRPTAPCLFQSTDLRRQTLAAQPHAGLCRSQPRRPERVFPQHAGRPGRFPSRAACGALGKSLPQQGQDLPECRGRTPCSRVSTTQGRLRGPRKHPELAPSLPRPPRREKRNDPRRPPPRACSGGSPAGLSRASSRGDPRRLALCPDRAGSLPARRASGSSSQ